MRSLWLATSRGSDRGGVGQKAGGRTPGLDNLPIQPAASSHAQTTFPHWAIFRVQTQPYFVQTTPHVIRNPALTGACAPPAGGRRHCAPQWGDAYIQRPIVRTTMVLRVWQTNFDVERSSAIAVQSSRKLERDQTASEHGWKKVESKREDGGRKSEGTGGSQAWTLSWAHANGPSR